ncbi:MULTISPECIES: dihydrofolate reductase family protein [unclassified Ensifer]|uniref:dihydrofolate reductase family protein n=1 Tax=unclassified Ensifer TaxID=2633371 RepID=UPI000812EB6E|nr:MULTISPECIES: dihydrofolate reductase family protein [unclassified Ensifer]OCO99242.1 riboflavin biosynthesis protein RibD [Ensifer sp. LC11]OCO99451.1 riboflavin biosynthesis protein RibD [Ensifer sp. LC13]OCP14399.1 riboflavin biosynthesis protein RibD [Ensifer sp. LC14]OCP29511.1 riboflavin biosynthesis protein RibD [Ensifer sp. LC499]
MTKTTGRRVAANLALTLDGRYSGPGGAGDLGAIVPYAVTDVARNHMARIWESATTAVLGRINAEGFLGYWSAVAGDAAADPRDRGYARWLVGVEKVVFSRTLSEAPWERTRIANGSVVDVVSELKASGEGDILINSSAGLIKALLAADMVDRLYLMICPEIVGGGPRLFDDGLPGTKWSVAHQETGERGEIALVYDRAS